jgi:serine/threonine protein kinase
MNTISHPFIVKLFDVTQQGDDLYVIMEYVQNGTLIEYLNRGKPALADLVRLFCQLVSAIHYLHHDVNFVHRDIKMENILLDEYENVRLVDFGFSKQLEDRTAKTTTMCGSLPYCAPEVFQSIPYGKPVDVWSLGVCLYAMALGKMPFDSPSRSGIVDLVCSSEPEIPRGTPSPIADLLARMLRKDPAARITIEEIAQHPWIRNSVWTIYFERNFHSMTITKPELPMLRKGPSDGAPEVENDLILRKIIARKQHARMAATPEIFVTGGTRIGLSMGEIGSAPPSGMPPVPRDIKPIGMAHRLSVLEGVQNHAGVRTRRVATPGCIAIRSNRRLSSLYGGSSMVVLHPQLPRVDID